MIRFTNGLTFVLTLTTFAQQAKTKKPGVCTWTTNVAGFLIETSTRTVLMGECAEETWSAFSLTSTITPSATSSTTPLTVPLRSTRYMAFSFQPLASTGTFDLPFGQDWNLLSTATRLTSKTIDSTPVPYTKTSLTGNQLWFACTTQ